MPVMCASSTMALISSSVSCWAPGVSPWLNTPPVAQILITWAPYLCSWRTILRPSSGLSITASLFCFIDGGKNVESQWPPVEPIA